MQFGSNRLFRVARMGALAAFCASVAFGPVSGSLLASAQAAESHDSGHDNSSHAGKGPKYKGGRGAEGHGGSDNAHKGNSSHGGGSKTLEDVIFHSDGGHSTGSASDKGGKKFMGGGKGGHEESATGHGDEDSHGAPESGDAHQQAE